VHAAALEQRGAHAHDLVAHGVLRGWPGGHGSATPAWRSASAKKSIPPKLPDLSGWLVFPQGFPASRVRLKIRDWPKQADGYIPRPDLQRPLKAINVGPSSGGGDESGYGATPGLLENAKLVAARMDSPKPVDVLPAAAVQIEAVATSSATAPGNNNNFKAGTVRFSPGIKSTPKTDGAQPQLPTLFDADRATDIAKTAVDPTRAQSDARTRLDQMVTSNIQEPIALQPPGNIDDDSHRIPVAAKAQSNTPDTGELRSAAKSAGAASVDAPLPGTPGSVQNAAEDLTVQEARMNFGTGPDGQEIEQDYDLGQ